jgi:DNA invertase Pin-like site-specific DNA recombinase
MFVDGRNIAMPKLVLYTRVSTSHQGEHGLGIAAQLKALREYANQGDHEVIRPEYIEVQSGGDDSRPILAEAVKQCRLYGATLCVAKADRLTRTGETVERFAKRNKIEVIALDNVNGDDVLAEMQAFVGSLERKLISGRTRAALQALKASGKALGGDRGGRAPTMPASLPKRLSRPMQRSGGRISRRSSRKSNRRVLRATAALRMS